ncbi:MAG: hypothetical protein U5K33_06100 [Halofilum sp. (in: g-proteobacteria)]|nr:hypothetical protein [Halofilum sp. (in: g-proteobacteria)]
MIDRATITATIRRRLAPTRSWSAVPPVLRIVLPLLLLVQLAWHGLMPGPRASVAPLDDPPPEPMMRLAALGEPRTLAAAGLLRLQFHDTQPGRSIPFRELDYDRIRAWLERLLALAPDSDYPLLLAVRIYGQVDDPVRQRKMLDFVRSAFIERPRDRWRWLAEAIIIAKHRLDAPRLALDYARLLNQHTRPGEIPFWARDLQVLLLQDLGELESARILIGGMLASGAITDPHEIRFLEQKLRELENSERDNPEEGSTAAE